MVAYVFGVIGIFRLASGLLGAEEGTQGAAQLGGFLAAFAYAANPNLLYMQATALTEPLYLALLHLGGCVFSGFCAGGGER